MVTGENCVFNALFVRMRKISYGTKLNPRSYVLITELRMSVFVCTCTMLLLMQEVQMNKVQYNLKIQLKQVFFELVL